VLREQIARTTWIDLQFMSEVSGEDAEIVGFFDATGAPYCFEQETVGEHLTGILDKRSQQAVFDGESMEILRKHQPMLCRSI